MKDFQNGQRRSVVHSWWHSPTSFTDVSGDGDAESLRILLQLDGEILQLGQEGRCAGSGGSSSQSTDGQLDRFAHFDLHRLGRGERQVTAAEIDHRLPLSSQIKIKIKIKIKSASLSHHNYYYIKYYSIHIKYYSIQFFIYLI